MATGLACAILDSVPIVAITGQVARESIGKDAFQETDVTGVTLPITKHNYLVMHASEIPQAIKEAFYIAKSGRPGPVLVDIPKDVFNEVAEFNYPDNIDLPGYKPTLEGNPAQIKRAGPAHRPSPAPPSLSPVTASPSPGRSRRSGELAERTQIPVITTFLGLSSFPEDHPLYVGMPGMHGAAYASLAIDQSDLLIAVGMRFDDRVTGKISAFAPGAKIIHVDIDPAEIGKNVRPTVPIVGDAKHVLRQLLPMVEPATHPEWVAHVEQMRREHPLTGAGLGNGPAPVRYREDIRPHGAAAQSSSPAWVSTRCGPGSSTSSWRTTS